MFGIISGAFGLGVGGFTGTGFNALGAGVLEKWIAPRVDASGEQARLVGIIAGGAAAVSIFGPSSFATGFNAGIAINTVFWATVNGNDLSYNREKCLKELVGMGLGMAVSGLTALVCPYPAVAVVAGSALARYVATYSSEDVAPAQTPNDGDYSVRPMQRSGWGF
jgi:hypothetical protein